MFLALAVLVAPLGALAHEHATFVINGQTYNFVVGSLNEPIAVDDKTGVSLSVTKGEGHHTMGPDGDMDGPIVGTKPVEGLADTLKVELIAGDQKKTLSLKPSYGEEGVYEAPFYPTVATTMTYRFFGTIDGNPVDLAFTCKPAGTIDHDSHDDAPKKISDTITQTMRGGGFGCAVAKEDLGFPEKAPSLVSLTKPTVETMAALGLSVLALAVGVYALRRKSA